MSKDICHFARAERLALFSRDTLGLSGVALNDALHEWRDAYRVPLSSWALSVITAHVAPGSGAEHIGAMPPEPAHTLPMVTPQ